MTGIIIGPRKDAKAGAQAPAQASRATLKPQRYRVLFTQTTVHMHYVEAIDAENAECLACQQFADGLHSCLAGCSCTQPDVIDIIAVTGT